MTIDNIYISLLQLSASTEAYKNKFQKIIFDVSKISEMDGYSIALYSMLVVFFALSIIVIFFLITGKISFALNTKKLNPIEIKKQPFEKTSMSNDVHAAICMALLMHINDTHDDESGIITINKIERRYSPWSSKIYNINKKPF